MTLNVIDNIKLLFWNLGDKLTTDKEKLVLEAIVKISPDIFCISEGTPSIKTCETIIKIFENKGYHCYYSPLHYIKNNLKKPYDYNDLGLKIFVKNEELLKEKFEFNLQREEGRIVILKTYINFRPTTIILLHCKSLAGSDHSTKEQHIYFVRLKDMLDLGKVTINKSNKEIMGETERLIIVGDFNIQPWESVLNSKDYLQTSFLTKHNQIKNRKKDADVFFNPSVEYIINIDKPNLGGTFYSQTHGWAILDYLLYKTADGITHYEIITKFIDGSDLLKQELDKEKDFLNYEIDHLPILITAK